MEAMMKAIMAESAEVVESAESTTKSADPAPESASDSTVEPASTAESAAPMHPAAALSACGHGDQTTKKEPR
jgi:hypothetical protein